MESVVAKQLRGRDPAELEDLLIEGIKANRITGIDDKFVNLKTLSLVGLGLQSLENFPSLPNLRRLILSDNKISGNLQALSAVGLPQLVLLDLSNNRITTIETLSPLRSLENLKHLDLAECEVSKAPGFKDAVFELIPSLLTLNGSDFDGNEVDIEEDEEEDEEDEDEEEEPVVTMLPPRQPRAPVPRSGNPEEDEEEEEEEGEEGEEEGEEEEEDDDEGIEGETTLDEYGLDVLEKDDLQDDESDGEYEPFDHRHTTLAREEEDARLEAELDDEEDEEDEEGDGEEGERDLKRGREDEDGEGFSNKFLKED